MYNGKLIRVYNRDKTHTSCAIYSQKNEYKLIEHNFYSSKPIKIVYVDKPFSNIDFIEDEIQFGLELIGFTDWDSYIHPNPCLGFAKQENGVVSYYKSAYESPISEDKYAMNFALNGFTRE